jgi:F-type H+-transporting ATPase subunit alpha
LDKATQNQLARGRRLIEILKQAQYSPYSVEKQVATIYAATNGFVDHISETEVKRFTKEFLEFLDTRHAKILTAIREKKQLDDETKRELKAACEEFKAVFRPTKK